MWPPCRCRRCSWVGHEATSEPTWCGWPALMQLVLTVDLGQSVTSTTVLCDECLRGRIAVLTEEPGGRHIDWHIEAVATTGGA